jgi:MFS superfamily sulfate permease-like transporter
MLVVILAQSAATSRAYAAKFNDEFDENVDLIGLGFANLGAGLTGTFVVNGSPTKTAMVDDAGGRSQLTQLTTGLVVAVVLLFFTSALRYLPDAVLAAVVFLIGVQLVDVKGMRRILQRRPVEFVVALATAATVVLLGVEQGILLAIVLSMIAHLRHSYRPNDRLLFPTVAGDWRSGPLSTGVQAAPGLIVYRFGASLYYANASRFAEEVKALVDQASVPIRWFCLAAGVVEDLDYTGSAVLKAVVAALDERGVTFVACDVHAFVLTELKRDGLLDVIGPQNIFASVGEALQAYTALPGPDGATDARAGDASG